MVEDSTTKVVVESAAKGGVSAVMPYAALGVVGYLLYKKVGDIEIDPFGGFGEGIGAGLGGFGADLGELGTTITESLKSAGRGGADLLEAGQEHPILKFITPDIQYGEMTPHQAATLEKYKGGKVTVETVAAPGSLYEKLFLKDKTTTGTGKGTGKATIKAAFIPGNGTIGVSPNVAKLAKAIKKKEEHKPFIRGGSGPLRSR